MYIHMYMHKGYEVCDYLHAVVYRTYIHTYIHLHPSTRNEPPNTENRQSYAVNDVTLAILSYTVNGVTLTTHRYTANGVTVQEVSVKPLFHDTL